MHTKINFIMNLVGRALHHYSLFLLSYPLSIKAVKSQMAVGPEGMHRLVKRPSTHFL